MIDDPAAKTLLAFARANRGAPTKAEKRLWRFLRAGRLNGFKLRRQHRIKNYIVDFVCMEEKLVIELDGGYHDSTHQYESDRKRSGELAGLGFRVMRFWNPDVLDNTETVVKAIEWQLAHPLSPTLPPLRGARENIEKERAP